jgi:hypothetical protein
MVPVDNPERLIYKDFHALHDRARLPSLVKHVIHTMKIYRSMRAHRPGAGFINPEGAVLGAMLAFIAAILLPAARHFHSHGLLVLTLILGCMSVILIVADLLRTHRYRQKSKKRNDKDR